MNKLRPSTCPWQRSLRACLHHKDHHLAKNIHALMLSRGHTPFIVSSNLLISLLAKNRRIEEARQVFDEMPQRDDFSWNTMIAGYAKSGMLDEAREVFEHNPNRISISWSSLISGYALHGSETDALELFWRMQLEGVRPDQYTLGSILRACSVCSALRRGKQIHAHVVKACFESNVFVVTGLVDLYGRCRRIGDASNLFDGMAERNQVLWTAVITGFAQSGNGLRAVEYFREMRRESVLPNQFTFPSVLTACSGIFAIEFGAQVHGCIIQTGFGGNVFVESALIDMYTKCRDLGSARMVLETMKVADEVSWNCMIVGCVREGCEVEALSLFKKMHIRNMKLDDFTFPSVLNSIARLVDLENGKSVHSLIVRSGCAYSNHVGNALVDMYAKCGALDYAGEVFAEMPKPDVVSWTSLITGYGHHGFHEEALKLFCRMRIAGVDSDEFIIAGVLSACAGLTVLELGRQVHVIFIKSGYGASLSIDNSLVTMYAKCGCIEDAHMVFDSMPIRDVVSWTALIVGYAQNGRGEDSLQLYEKMIESKTKPDYITFIGLLFACSHAGLVDHGLRYFDSMYKIHGINRGAEHYACMIDLLGRAGKIDEAEKLLNEMPVKPDATVWKALLAACRIHGNMELGERAAKSLFGLEPENAMPYVLLSNIYSAAGRWEDAANIRRLMKLKGVSKEPGCSWIEVNSIVHTFLSEDRGHPMATEIYSKINEIMILIREAGYVPDMNFALHDVDEEGKELALAYHSEKLAVAFGLLRVSQGAPIRIFKNLRVCGDCHSAMKFISKVFSQHIVVRDSNCFHHFRVGMCSCRDYW